MGKPFKVKRGKKRQKLFTYFLLKGFFPGKKKKKKSFREKIIRLFSPVTNKLNHYPTRFFSAHFFFLSPIFFSFPTCVVDRSVNPARTLLFGPPQRVRRCVCPKNGQAWRFYNFRPVTQSQEEEKKQEDESTDRDEFPEQRERKKVIF